MRLLGGIHPNDENFNEKAWIESLEDFKNWERIELQNPINIFQLLPDDLRKQIIKSVGKRIYYSTIENFNYKLVGYEYRRPRVFELNIPPDVRRVIQNKDADCNI